jgi:hypothetical protein
MGRVFTRKIGGTSVRHQAKWAQTNLDAARQQKSGRTPRPLQRECLIADG